MTLMVADRAPYDPSTGKVEFGYIGPMPASYPVIGVKFDYVQSEIDGTSIKVGDQYILLDPALPVTPATGDQVHIGCEVFTIIRSKPLAHAGDVVLHNVQVRGGP